MRERTVHIAKTFLAGTFLGAAGLNVLTGALGIKAKVVLGSLLPAISVGDLIEGVGAILVGGLATYLVRRRQAARHP